MKVIQLDVCSDEQVDNAVKYIKDNLADSEKGDQLYLQCVCSFTDIFLFDNLSLVIIQDFGLW